MNRRDFPTEADYLRAHREAFCLALELKITPKEAEVELQRRKALAYLTRLQAKIQAPLKPGMPELARDGAEKSEPWMMRD